MEHEADKTQQEVILMHYLYDSYDIGTMQVRWSNMEHLDALCGSRP